MPKIPDCYLPRILFWLVLFLSSSELVRAASPPGLEPRGPYLVTLELSFSDGEPVVVTVYDGGLAKFEHAARRYSVGITPSVTDPLNGVVELEVRTLVSNEEDREEAGLSETLRGKAGFRSVTSVGNQPLDVKVVAIESQSGITSQQCLTITAPGGTSTSDCDSELEHFIYQSDGCCVSCGGQSTCGCAVSTGCGTCCNCPFC